MVKKFVITGPESTGKSTLTNLLAKEYDCSFVKEYAREYLDALLDINGDNSYSFEDVLTMAKEQLRQEEKSNEKLVLLDTDLTVYAVWIKEKYKKEIDWIESHLANSTGKIYMLCDIDIPWVDDPLREHPDKADRLRLFNCYKSLFEKYQLSYHIISGDISTRLKKCKEIIDTSI